MNIAEIESKIGELVQKPYNQDTFIFDFLSVFDNIPKATLTKLRQGSGNQSKVAGEVLWKKNVFFKHAPQGNAAKSVSAMVASPLIKQHAPRFVMSTDGNEFYCRDAKVDQFVDVEFSKLNDVFDFFLPLAGIERYEAVTENPADIKATARIAKLYDAILEANPDWIDEDHTHELNLFMTRLLFCFFSEDTSIFDRGVFTKTVISTTKEDGSDTSAMLQAIFLAMDTPLGERTRYPEFVKKFPYVNGGLFKDRTPVPQFSRRARRLLSECGSLSWQEINPDIFGSMIQAVVQPSLRGDLGMHYTSVPNIMKVIQPLFLMSLEEEFEASRDNEAKLLKLRDRLYRIRVFDPACGSGNFLIIAYRELRKIENRILARLKEVAQQAALPMSGINLSQFFGIEFADFAAETAKLSLWIAEYQMNEQFKAMFGSAPPMLPLKDSGRIVQGNATRIDWLDVCPSSKGLEIYIVGNPPYLGGKKLSKNHSDDMDAAGLSDMKQLDYIGCWFIKASEYCSSTGNKFSFVTTSSVCQGEQVHILWSCIFGLGLDIEFAYEPFKWSNNAADNAGVMCSVIGLKPSAVPAIKRIFNGEYGRVVKNISPYLIEGDNEAFVKPSSFALNQLPAMCMGSNPVDGTNLVVSEPDFLSVTGVHPESKVFFRRYMGAEDFINGMVRYCIWIDEKNKDEALCIPFIADRIRMCAEYRKGAGRDAKKVADKPYRFCYRTHKNTQAILFPKTTASTRTYVPCGYTDASTVINVDAFAIYDPEPHVFAVVSSALHRVWLAATAGRLGSGFRYSVKLVYNTFPVPHFSKTNLENLESHVWHIIAAREAYAGKTVGWLYDPETMPDNLRKAHQALDDTLERIYIGRPFKNDTERLEHLFKLYAAMSKKVAVLDA